MATQAPRPKRTGCWYNTVNSSPRPRETVVVQLAVVHAGSADGGRRGGRSSRSSWTPSLLETTTADGFQRLVNSTTSTVSVVSTSWCSDGK